MLVTSPLVTSPLESRTVRDAYARISSFVERTPVLTSTVLSNKVATSMSNPVNPAIVQDIRLFFKAENFQKTGSFKYRGALHSIVALRAEELACGLATTSSGNHAKSLAAAAAALATSANMTIPVWAVMPENALQSKMRAVETLGGTVVKSGRSWAARSAALSAICKDTGATMISADDNPNILLGQGTVGLEFVEQVRELYKENLDCIVAPCGTGGLLSGLALAFKDSPVTVFGVEPQNGADDAMRGRELGKRINVVSSTSIADGLRSPVSPLAWEIIRQNELVEDIVSVDEEQILAAVRLAASELKLIIEPSAAVGLAALLFNKRLQLKLRGMCQPCRIGVVFTGGNVPLEDLAAMFSMD